MLPNQVNEVQISSLANRQKRNAWIIGIISAFVVFGILIIGLMYYVQQTVRQYDDKIFPSVSIAQLDMSGKTKTEARTILQNEYEKKMIGKKIIVEAKGTLYTLPLEATHFSFETDEAIEQAFAFGKDESLLKSFFLIKTEKTHQISIPFTFDENHIKKFVQAIAKKSETKPTNATISIVNGVPVIKNNEDGFTLKEVELLAAITEAMNDSLAVKTSIAAMFTVTPAKRTTEQLQSINTKIGGFSTSFGGSDAGRATNIRIATKTINGYLLMPGESFSFNNFVGDTTADKGYQPAGAYQDGEVIMSFGGGVCQVSTTLYNSIISAGIKPDQRFNHSMTVGYVPVGQDAAIAYGGKDFVFSNSFDYPVYIEGYTYGATIGFNVYSNDTVKESGVNYRLVSQTVSTSPAPVKEEKDATLPVGETKVKSEGSSGIQTVTYFQKLKNGSVVSSEAISYDSYRGKAKVVVVGTKKVANASTSEDEITESQNL